MNWVDPEVPEVYLRDPSRSALDLRALPHKSPCPRRLELKDKYKVV